MNSDFPPLGAQPEKPTKKQRSKFSAGPQAATMQPQSPKRLRSRSVAQQHSGTSSPPPKRVLETERPSSPSQPSATKKGPKNPEIPLYAPPKARKPVSEETPKTVSDPSEVHPVTPVVPTAVTSPSQPSPQANASQTHGNGSKPFVMPDTTKPPPRIRGMPKFPPPGGFASVPAPTKAAGEQASDTFSNSGFGQPTSSGFENTGFSQPDPFDVSHPSNRKSYSRLDSELGGDGDFFECDKSGLFPYTIVQMGGTCYTAILDTATAKRSRIKLPHGLPVLIKIDQKCVEPWGESRPFNAAILPIGTNIGVARVIAYRTNRGPKSTDDKVSAYIRSDGMLTPSGYASGLTIKGYYQPNREPAIVVAMSKDGLIRVTDRFHPDSAVLPERALRTLTNRAQLKEGDVIALWTTLPKPNDFRHQDSQYTYILPADHPMIDRVHEERVKNGDKFPQIVLAEPWPADEAFDLDHIFRDWPQDRLPKRMNDYEDLLLASVARAHEQVRYEMEHATYEGKFSMISDNIASINITLPEKKQAKFSNMAKFWKEDAVFNIITPGEKSPCGSACISASEVDHASRKISATFVFEPSNPNQVDIDPKTPLGLILSGAESAIVALDTDQTGFKFAFDQLNNRRLRELFTKKLTSLLSLSEFLGMPKPAADSVQEPKFPVGNPAAEPQRQIPADSEIKEGAEDENMDTEPTPADRPLNKQQRKAMQMALDDSTNLGYMSSPPGSGKTFVAGKFAAELKRTRPAGKAVLLTATTNHAAINLAEAVDETKAFKPDEVLMLQSHSYYRTHREEIEGQPWSRSRLVEHVKRLIAKNAFSEDEKKAMTLYVKKIERGHSIRVDDSKALSLVLRFIRPRVIIATIGTAQRVCAKIAPITTRLVIDEIGQVSETTFVTLLTGLTMVQNIFLAGDKMQLGLYDANVPQHVRKYGHRSMLDVITELRKPRQVSLRQVYRSHPFMVERVVKAIYEEDVETALTEDDRTLCRDVLGTKPVTFIRCDTPEDPHPVRSQVNHHQTEIAVKCATKIKEMAPDSSVVVLNYYALQTEEVAQRLKNTGVQSHTITSYQGRQADVVILTTTRAHPTNDNGEQTAVDPQKYDFVLDNRRTNVGLTRAKELLIIIGDDELLQFGDVWLKIINKLKEDQIVDSENELEFMLAMMEPLAQDMPSQDLDEDADGLEELSDST